MPVSREVRENLMRPSSPHMGERVEAVKGLELRAMLRQRPARSDKRHQLGDSPLGASHHPPKPGSAGSRSRPITIPAASDYRRTPFNSNRIGVDRP